MAILSFLNRDHKTIIATVTQGSAPKSGETVSFSSDNTSVATVSPASAATDSSGQAQATVASQNKGDTQVHASGAGASAQSHVKVPLLSRWLLLLLFCGAITVYLRRLHQEKRSRG